MAGNLYRAIVRQVSHDHLFVGAAALDPNPHSLAQQPVGDGVLAVFEGDHRGVGRDLSRGSERDRIRMRRDRLHFPKGTDLSRWSAAIPPNGMRDDWRIRSFGCLDYWGLF